MILTEKNPGTAVASPPRIRFDRNEFAGAFGDIGTDFPLIVGMILVAHLDTASVLIMFGLMQILTGFFYRMPMPAQPLKAVAALVITQKITGNTLYGGGLAIGVTMLLLTVTGLVSWLGRVIPKTVVRGIQFGLGLQLTTLALKDYIPREGAHGFWLAGIAFVVTIALLGNRKYPAAILVILLGIFYAFAFKLNFLQLQQDVAFALPKIHTPSWQDIATGFLVLALPQIPLSIGNSILAAQQTARDLFPERSITLRKISFTYSLMNLINPFFGGIPTCHGSGGLAGHYAFGARTGGSEMIYGSIYLLLGFLFSGCFETVAQIFPLPILGVILCFEGITLMLLLRDISESKFDFFLAILVGAMAANLPYGYLIALVSGTAIFYVAKKFPRMTVGR